MKIGEKKKIEGKKATNVEKIKSEKKVGAPFFMSGFATDSEG